MICPFCEHTEHRVVESRVSDAKDAIRRRRECLACKTRFTTYERIEEVPVMVVKSSGEREPFDRDKLLAGLQRACHKRPVPTPLLAVAVRDIEAEIRNVQQAADAEAEGIEYHYGVDFHELGAEDRMKIKSLVYQTIIEQPRRII